MSAATTSPHAGGARNNGRCSNHAENRGESEVLAIWEDLVSNKPSLLPVSEREQMRSEFIAVFMAACDFDEKRARDALKHFQMTWEPYRDPDFTALYIFLGFVFVIATVFMAMRRAVRDTDKAVLAFNQRCVDLKTQYESILEDQAKHLKPSGS